jgi:hypothetical protein
LRRSQRFRPLRPIPASNAFARPNPLAHRFENGSGAERKPAEVELVETEMLDQLAQVARQYAGG